jgi:hypothetical protein
VYALSVFIYVEYEAYKLQIRYLINYVRIEVRELIMMNLMPYPEPDATASRPPRPASLVPVFPSSPITLRSASSGSGLLFLFSMRRNGSLVYLFGNAQEQTSGHREKIERLRGLFSTT